MLTTIACTLLLPLAPVDDWPQWRGPARDGVSRESSWSSTGHAQSLWEKQVGTGYSNCAIADGRLFTLGYDEDAEEDIFWCLDAATGEELWSQRYAAAPLANFHGGGTLSSPTVDGAFVYATNRYGVAFCRKVANGEVVWRRDYGAELELKPTFHGFSASPLVQGDELILVFGGTVAAISKADGELRWRTEDYGDGGYANPVPFELDGAPRLAVFAGVGLLILDRADGQELQRVPWKSTDGGVSAATPIVLGSRVFFSSAYDMGCALVELQGAPEPEVVWSNKSMRCKVGDVFLWEDHLYGFDESMLKCVDLEGSEQWRVRGLGMGALSIAGGRLLVLSSKGELIIADAAPDAFRELSRAKVLEPGGACWTAPVLVDGRIYCRSSLGQLVCRDHTGGAATAVTGQALPDALPVAAELCAAHVTALGGADALRAHRSYRATGSIEILGAGITRNTMTLERMVPDLWHLSYENGFSTVQRCYDGELGWQLDSFYGDEIYPDAKLKELRETLRFHADTEYAAAYNSLRTTGAVTFGDRPCWRVDAVTTGGTRRRLYFDRETGLLVGREAETEAMVVYADYALFGDVRLPRRTTALIPDTGAEETYFIDEVVFDTVELGAFARPDKILRMLRTPAEIAAADDAVRAQYASHLGAFVADFEPHNGAHVTVRVQDGGLVLDVPGQQPFVLLPPDAEGRWKFAISDAFFVEFLEAVDGTLASIRVTRPDGTNELPRAPEEAAAAPLPGLYGADSALPARTWVDVDGARFGAEPDARGPLGGGHGYRAGVASGDHIVRDLDELLAALATAQPGEVIFVPGDAIIDCTGMVRIEQLVLELPGGVTLASDRGRNGSAGALLFSDELLTRPFIRVLGAGARVSGLRLRGPDPERRLDHHRRAYQGGRTREPDYYYALPTSDGIATSFDDLEVDGCELAGWSHAAVYLQRGTRHRVHHNFMHHNQRQGLGYGVCLDVAEAEITHNLFDWNRHSIAGTGRPGSGYRAAHNVERGTSLSHCFDMHGGRDRKDGTDIAGTWMSIERNAFLCPRTAFKVRGVPEREAHVEGNWCVHAGPAEALSGGARTLAGANAYGADEPRVVQGR